MTAQDGIITVLATWQTWVLIAAGIAGFFLLQNALQAGRLAASQPGITLATRPSRSSGNRLFHEHITTGWWLAGAGLGTGLLTGGALLLSRSPSSTPTGQRSERDA